MADSGFQLEILTQLKSFEWRFDKIEWRFDNLECRFDNLEWRFERLEGWFAQLEIKVDLLDEKVSSLDQKVGFLDGKIDSLSSDFRTFQGNQEEFNNAIWNMTNQSFVAINEIRQEVLPPWKSRKSRS